MTKTVVVDASLVVMLVLSEPHSPKVERLIQTWTASRIRLSAPPLLRGEITNALYKAIGRKEITFEQAMEALSIVEGLNISYQDGAELYARALQLARDHQQTTTYDAIYMALAEKMGCPFWSGDERLYNSVRRRFPNIRWVGEAEQGLRLFSEWGPAFTELADFLRRSTWVRDLGPAMGRYGHLNIQVEHLSWGTTAIVRGVRASA